jgi:hypothetical protein
VVVSLALELTGLPSGSRTRDFAGRASGHFTDVPERQFEAGGDLGDGQA